MNNSVKKFAQYCGDKNKNIIVGMLLTNTNHITHIKSRITFLKQSIFSFINLITPTVHRV